MFVNFLEAIHQPERQNSRGNFRKVLESSTLLEIYCGDINKIGKETLRNERKHLKIVVSYLNYGLRKVLCCHTLILLTSEQPRAALA